MTPEELLDPLKKDWQYLLQKRIDALVELKDQVWIIEVNAEAGQRSIGQLFTYQTLWLRDPKIRKLEKLILVSRTMDSDLIDVAGSRGIQIFLV